MENNIEIVSFKIDELNLYRKKKVEALFVQSLEIAKEGIEITIHTLEGDVIVKASPEIYIILGVCNDVYPIKRELFKSRYKVLEKDIKLDDKSLFESMGWRPCSVGKCILKKILLFMQKRFYLISQYM